MVLGSAFPVCRLERSRPAADARVSCADRWLPGGRDKLAGHKEVLMTRLRKMMLEELQRRNYAQNTIRHYIRTVADFARRFNCSPDRLGPRHLREYQAGVVPEGKVIEHGHTTLGGTALLLRQDAQESLEHCRDPPSEARRSPANVSQSGTSGATHRCR